MATVKGINTEQELAELRRLGASWARAKDKLDELARERDDAIAAASSKGASRRTVAEAAGVTVGRVQQILTRDR